jgi:hypothetical protein
MAPATDHEHSLDAEYLYPADARVTDLYASDGDLRISAVVPCPECDEVVEIDASVETVAESDIEVLEDVDDLYD